MCIYLFYFFFFLFFFFFFLFFFFFFSFFYFYPAKGPPLGRGPGRGGTLLCLSRVKVTPRFGCRGGWAFRT